MHMFIYVYAYMCACKLAHAYIVAVFNYLFIRHFKMNGLAP